ncbi:hypothetical protein [Chryseobacterium sp. G0201]|uniref:hypothetical protein n=1 Tax=Chryseobacterium sp. G0201 TaxID=2487065 RepID=UPI000F511004|nr:hypothetical protein [Chryseobacterium sp. G0201]AZA52172.1 hypothetical protein EG348_03700 [Chryseobacterium sp. G0201]
MKKFLFLSALFLSIQIFGCKCTDLNIENSFKTADFVFIGNIYSVKETPSGYKTLSSLLSSMKIEKIFKSENYDGFYVDQATLFTSQLRSCDYPFNEKGKYLIFGYFDSDLGFIYSERCLATKKISSVSQDELQLLEKLSTDFKQELKNTENPEIIEVLEDSGTPNREINTLKRDLISVQSENKNLKITIIVTSISLILLLIILILKKRKK